MIVRSQQCDDFECAYKDRCINFDSLCESLPGCPRIYRTSICKCCTLCKVCPHRKVGVINGKHG